LKEKLEEKGQKKEERRKENIFRRSRSEGNFPEKIFSFK